MIPKHIKDKKAEWLKHIESGRPDLLREAIAHVHPADQAEVLRTLGKAELLSLLGTMEDEQIGGVLRYLRLDRGTRLKIIESLPDSRRANIFGGLSSQVIADISAGMDSGEIAELLSPIPSPRLQEIQALAAEEKRGADRLMTRDYLTVRADDTASAVLSLFRNMRHTEGRPSQVYVVDSRGLLSGMIELHLLLLAPSGETPISAIMKDCPLRISAGSDPLAAARSILYYGLNSGPVVNRTNELVGVITADAAYMLLEQRHEAAMNCVGAVGRTSDRAGSAAGTVRHAFSLAPIIAASIAASALLQLLIRHLIPADPGAYLFAWAPLAVGLARLYYWHVSLLLQKLDSTGPNEEDAERAARVRAGVAAGLLFAPVTAAAAWASSGSLRIAAAAGGASIWAIASGALSARALSSTPLESRVSRSMYITPLILTASDLAALAFMVLLFFLPALILSH